MAEDSYVSVNPLGIGFVVLVGTMVGTYINYPAAQPIGLVVVGLVHGGMAALASWVAFSAFRLFADQRRERR